MSFKEIKISDLTGVLKSYAEAEDKKGNNNNKIDTEAEYSVFMSAAETARDKGYVDDSEFKRIFGLEDKSLNSDTNLPLSESSQNVVMSAPVNMSKKDTKRANESVADLAENLIKSGKYNIDNLLQELRNQRSNPKYAASLKEVEDLINFVKSTNYNSKEDVKAIHKKAKEKLKAEDKWDSFHKDLLDSVEKLAEEEQINKEFKSMVALYNEVKNEYKQAGLALNFNEIIKAVKEQVKDNKSYTKEAFNRIEDLAKSEAMTVTEDRMTATSGVTKREIRKELRAKAGNDDYQKDAIQELKADRKRFARKHKVEGKIQELSSVSEDELLKQLGEMGNQYNFAKKLFTRKRIARNIFEKLDNSYLQKVKNSDGTYDLSELAQVLKDHIGDDYKENLSKDEKMSERYNVKVALKDLTGEDFTDNQVGVLLNLFDFERAHKDHTPKLFKNLKNVVTGTAVGASDGGKVHQSQIVTIKFAENASASSIKEQLDKQGIKYTSTELENGGLSLKIIQDQTVDTTLFNILKGAGIGILTGAMMDIIFGNTKEEESCISISDYQPQKEVYKKDENGKIVLDKNGNPVKELVENTTYTNPDEYKKHFANTTKNKEKIVAMNHLVDAYVEKYGQDKWHSELHEALIRMAGTGSKLNPEECREIIYNKPLDKQKTVEDKPEEKTVVENPVTEPVKDCKDSKWESGVKYVKMAGHTWENVIRAYYPDCFANTPEADFYDIRVRRNGKLVVVKEGIITKFKKALSIDKNGNFDNKKYLELKNNNDLPGIDSEGNYTYFPSEFLGCRAKENANPLRTTFKKAGKATRYSAGSHLYYGENCYTQAPVKAKTSDERDRLLDEARKTSKKATK